jgi:ABC-type lipoprotein release transport system permease subunit
MKVLLQLAWRNLIGAGLRTGLNVLVLSFALVMVVFYNGLLEGWNRQARTDSIRWQYGQGQWWHRAYDPYDPFSLAEAHGLPPQVPGLVPVLVCQASLFPQGRAVPTLLKGIPPRQSAVALPTARLDTALADGTIPVLAGRRMAEETGLQAGSRIALRWRDQHGTFDAGEAVVVALFDAPVPAIDQGQLWLPIERLWRMTGWEGHATFAIAAQAGPAAAEGWAFQSPDALLADLDAIIRSKRASGAILYLLLLGIALLAIFDTQVLSVFRRQREIGTYIALGMTRGQVMSLFTLEGAGNSVLAMLAGALYGLPLLGWLSQAGIGMPEMSSGMGLAVAARIYPYYSLGLVLGTAALMGGTATAVSFLPVRKIARMNPVDALKGKLQ